MHRGDIVSTDRRRAIWLAREAAKLPPDERVWIVLALTVGCYPPADETTFDRNAALRAYRQRWHSDLETDPAAKRIADEFAHYSASAWLIDQHRITPQSKDEKRRDQFAVMKIGAKLVGFEAMRKIV